MGRRQAGYGALVPELPDVEVFRRRLARTSLHRPVGRVRILDADLLRDTSARRLAGALRGSELARTTRHGKQLFAEVTGRGWLVLHFGMTGFLAPGSGDDGLPTHARVVIDFADGSRLVFVDQRKLGYVGLVDDPVAHVRRQGLGPDALGLGHGDLRELCRGWRGGVKALLMDQGAVAGIGNIYSDEVLLQARLDPRRPSRSLSGNESRRLHRQLGRVLTVAIDRHADPARLPRGWLLRHREPGVPCPRGDGTITKYRAGGRGAFRCPGCQR